MTRRSSPPHKETAPPRHGHGAKSRISPINVGLAMALILMIGYLVAPTLTRDDSPQPDYVVVNTYPHSPEAFTQGLAYHDGFLYEGTGEYGTSTIRKTRLETGEIIRNENLPFKFFGEGIVIHDGKLIQLTWQNKVGFIRDLESFSILKEFTYEGEGWGITNDGTNYIMSDGTSTLRFLDPQTMEVIKTMRVRDGDLSIRKINELEMYKGDLLANIWESNRIARISLETGAVIDWIDLSELRKEIMTNAVPGQRPDVLNGIAYDAQGDRLFVTGKRWPFLYEIRLTDP
ncbi:MAG: glutaminyl-peptide cyclotransferase [Planctomycetota bacterium]|nr:glutaminyl-peptide cyclotransferase [Planctomycetota bacterium]